jgi:hypothetical protein
MQRWQCCSVKDDGHDKKISTLAQILEIVRTVLVIGSSGRVRLFADIDFKNQNVVIRDMHAVSLKFGGGSSRDPLPFEEALSKTMQAFSSREGFDGVTFQETTLFLEQIVLPDQESFWCEAGLFRTLRQLREEEREWEMEEEIAISRRRVGFWGWTCNDYQFRGRGEQQCWWIRPASLSRDEHKTKLCQVEAIRAGGRKDNAGSDTS